MEKNICPLFGNIRNGNTQKLKIRENCYTEKISHSTVYNGILTPCPEPVDPSTNLTRSM